MTKRLQQWNEEFEMGEIEETDIEHILTDWETDRKYLLSILLQYETMFNIVKSTQHTQNVALEFPIKRYER